MRAGAVYLPLNTAYTPAELDYFIGDAEPASVVCDPAQARGVAAVAARSGATVDTLDAKGKGTLTDAAPTRRRRPSRRCERAADDLAAHPLHLGHHRPLQGRDADPRQPRLERR